MKTTILISSIAALFLIMTSAVAPTYRSTDNRETAYFSSANFIPVGNNAVESGNTASFSFKKISANSSSDKEANEFDYLKFNVSDYINNDDAEILNNEIAFDYLKFDVTKFAESSAFAHDDEIELPEQDLSYLKFNTNKFIQDDNSNESSNLPTDEFSYLKFDVNKFTTNPTDNMPVNE
jgi:hypothetical protein